MLFCSGLLFADTSVTYVKYCHFLNKLDFNAGLACIMFDTETNVEVTCLYTLGPSILRSMMGLPQEAQSTGRASSTEAWEPLHKEPLQLCTGIQSL